MFQPSGRAGSSPQMRGAARRSTSAAQVSNLARIRVMMMVVMMMDGDDDDDWSHLSRSAASCSSGLVASSTLALLVPRSTWHCRDR